MKTVHDLNQYGLDFLELKALSVPSSLRFLLGIEYDVVLCVNEVGTRRPFRLHFPVFAPTLRKLLSLCAKRFGLDCEHGEAESVLTGTALMPLLRYADYLPGALHVKEILECLQVEPAAKARKWMSPAASPALPSASVGSDATTDNAAATAGTSNEFEASFIDYSEFSSDSSLDDVHGLGFYLLLDYGLSLATHSHLVGIRFHKDWDPAEALREFQEFSGWSEFDLRYHDEQRPQDGGVIIMPSSQDACDLLEKYEDEDSDDEGDLLPFILRPVSPLVPVPSLEDATLRKLRDQHWDDVKKHWTHLPQTLNTVVVYNLYEGATLAEVLSFFEPLPIVSSAFVEDKAPSHRRRAFITFANLEATRKALDVDGKNTRGCTLRVQVSPPYISPSRRGNPVKTERDCDGAGDSFAKTGSGGAAASTAAHNSCMSSSPTSSPSLLTIDNTTTALHGKAKPAGNGNGGAACETTSVAAAHVGAASIPTGKSETSMVRPVSTSPTPAYVVQTGSTLSGAAAAVPNASSFGGFVDRAAAVAGAIAARAHAIAAASAAPISPPKAMGGGAAPAASGAEKDKRIDVMSSPSGSHMNAAAKEFVPHFQLIANSPEYRPTPPPKIEALYGDYAGLPSLRDGVGFPPPPPPPPPPPSYVEALSPAPEYRPAPRSSRLSHVGASPSLPPYALPPPYVAGGDDVGDMFPPPPLPPPYLGD
ncbi:conserved hypothetical protein [Leishmania infantum JPCM5]|uniref:RNA-binding_protein_-_putative n=3 Tax=Leishmania donovani species complex TaxID=38574 RepID=A0A6L0XQT1_LEIIN|nr:conserved hypothetical protein [Leishmania infantum JPCM5]XP_003864904.1 hypothetical protein, conserved [Leishmania donovani]CAC9545699.1 RNA-binding_protein_-_putative [Leishmania infantum]AYU83125.1 RNA-binding protein, putative [Leishmania donovani]CAM72230.1 conserved hypothetical protein [Leishmania infantum JPCM5]CBZ38224.1 hypothetical protein, conserved [Leishmania donovani]SUZ46150.1 RNA-binding_protein_-_putative [Leishmania infantum]|eukprot:XP_001469130.1 conserved hypothetical protein [Leishmania infantum JPCM5]